MPKRKNISLLGGNPDSYYVPQLYPREKIEEQINELNKLDRASWMNLPQWNWCGICVLSMILRGLKIDHPPVPIIYKKSFDYGVYRLYDGKIIGAYHKELTRFIQKEFLLEAQDLKNITAEKIREIILEESFFIASVTSEIRNAPIIPQRKSGHLILIFGIENNKFIFHNSTGFSSNNTQRSVKMNFEVFEKYFSGRGIKIKKSQKDHK